MATKKKAKVKPVQTPTASEQTVLVAGMIWTDPKDGQQYNVVKSEDQDVPCKGCHFFDAAADCPQADSDGSPFCETSNDRFVQFKKITQAASSVVRTAPPADFTKVPKVEKSKVKKAKPAASLTVPIITGLTTCQRDIPAANLVHAEWNKRGVIEPEDVADLVASIKAVGLIQRIAVRVLNDTDYTILAGHRRFEACKIAGLEPIPCDVVECDGKKAHMITAIENMHRSELTAMQEAEVVEDLLEVEYTAEEIAEQTSWNVRRVYRRASLRTLTPKWRNTAHAHVLCAAFLEEVSRLPPATQDAVFGKLSNRWDCKKVFDNGGDVAMVKDAIGDLTMELSKAQWAKKHPEWCANCERCSNASTTLFDETEVGENAMCLDKHCWEQRKAALVTEQQVELKAKYGEVRTASGDDYRWGRLREAKSRKDKDHSVPVVITDGDNAGKTVWVAGAADKKAARARGDAVSRSKQPTLAEKRAVWVIRKVREKVDASRQKGSLDNPFLQFNDSAILQTVALTGTEHSSSWHKAKEWDGIESQTDEELKVNLWGRVAPVLIARMNYPTITDCDAYYKEAVAQAKWLFNIDKTDLDAQAAEVIKDKKASK